MAIPEKKISFDAEAVRRARVELAAAYRLAVRFGFNEGIDNHFSLLLPGYDDRMLLNPYPLHWSEVTASNLLLVDLQGHEIEGEHEVEPTAYHIHAAVHRADPQCFRCALHTHMPYATAIACREGGRLEMGKERRPAPGTVGASVDENEGGQGNSFRQRGSRRPRPNAARCTLSPGYGERHPHFRGRAEAIFRARLSTIW